LQQWLLNVLDTADKAVVLVTHDVDEAILLADRILVMAPEPGRIIADIKVDFEAKTDTEDISMSLEFNKIRTNILHLLSHQESVR
jgi:ABC-type nitrate/sulfonate/bicarbonate transport system ATPase subunit